MAYLASVSSVLGDEVSDVNELDAWLKANDSDPSGMYVLGDTSGEGVLKVEDDTLPTDVAAESSLLAMASSSSSAMETSGSSSGASTRTAAEITATELEVAQLRTKLAAQEAAFCDANATGC